VLVGGITVAVGTKVSVGFGVSVGFSVAVDWITGKGVGCGACAGAQAEIKKMSAHMIDIACIFVFKGFFIEFILMR
jgi:hypothetical protein